MDAVGGGEDPQEMRKASGMTWQRLKEQPHRGRKTSEVTAANGQGEECVHVRGG